MCNYGTEIETSKHFFLRCQFITSERHNLHGDLCLIDPPVIIFDGESLLNALLHGSDEFHGKINEEAFLRFIPNRADFIGVTEGDMPLSLPAPNFFV